MTSFSRRDLIFSVITGFYTGVIFWRILIFLAGPEFYGEYYGLNFSLSWLIVVVPILWILGVNLGYFLGRWFPFFNQFGKYAVIGFTNFAVDTGITNLLIAFSGHASGVWFSIFKTTSFVVAVSHSYYWNRNWAFSVEDGSSSSEESSPKRQFVKFMVVNLIAAAINVGTASFVVNGVEPFLGFSANVWANVGVFVGSAVSLIFSFVGFRLVVFRNQNLNIKM